MTFSLVGPIYTFNNKNKLYYESTICYDITIFAWLELIVQNKKKVQSQE